MHYPKTLIKIHAAAYHFAHISRELADIANAFGVCESAVRKWAKTETWTQALDTLGYEGNRKFASLPKRDTTREKPEILETTRTIYCYLLRAGVPRHRLPRLVAEATGVKQRNVYDWAKRYNWTAET